MPYLGLLLLALMGIFSSCRHVGGDGEDAAGQVLPADTRMAVEEAVRSLDVMRSSLAGGIGNEAVEAGTFAQVCKPVGMQAMEIGAANGWVVRQVAVRYRNPANQADEQAAGAVSTFEERPGQDSLWMRSMQADASGWRYLRRITVEPACLACHGPEASRPEFVKAGYPMDRAYDFEVGDLRGLYSVFVPDTSLARTPAPVPVPRLDPLAYVKAPITGAIVLDVRTPEEFSEGHLAGASNMDLRASDFAERASELDRDQVYYLYCRTGNRSAQAGAIMRSLGFKNLYNIGGLSGLEEAGAAVER